jgi:SAM-dependent methyltransferase
MFNQLPFQVSPYAALAPIYDQAGFAEYARVATPRYINYAQSIDWAGRRIIDLGCGTGVSSWWLSQQGYRTIGIDVSPPMLEQARLYVQAQVRAAQEDETRSPLEPPEFIEGDIRELDLPVGTVDLVLAVGGVLNAVHSLRELEHTFSQIGLLLEPERLFIFDMRTIQGLARDLGDRDRVLHDNGFNLLVTVRNQFSYESLSCTRHYIVMRQQSNAWRRADEVHTERGFPAQGVAAMLERAGFRLVAVLNPDMTPFNPLEDAVGRAVYIAQTA